MKLQGALENPGARRVLTTLLERHHSGLDRKKPPLLRLDARRMPEFGPQRRFGEGDEAWEAIKVFSEEGLLTIDRIRKRPDTAEFECEPTVRLVLVRAEEAARLLGLSFGPDPWTIAWVEGCNDATWLPTSLKGALIARRHRIGDRSPAEILGRWQRVATEVYDELTLREVSARLFWGLSKELDDRAEFVAALRGTHGLAALPELPILLPVFLSADWQERGVLFVENLAVYAACVQGRVGAARGFSLI